MSGNDKIGALISAFAGLPGLGPRSARRIVLHLLKRKDEVLVPMGAAMTGIAETVLDCQICGNLCSSEICQICMSERRSDVICVVQDVVDLWAIERAKAFDGKYHVLGGVLSVLDNFGPEQLRVPELMQRIRDTGTKEIILALNATIDGQTTAHYIAEQFADSDIRVTSLGHGMPIGGELDFLDGGTITAALTSRTNY